jgi:hypothetical protein
MCSKPLGMRIQKLNYKIVADRQEPALISNTNLIKEMFVIKRAAIFLNYRYSTSDYLEARGDQFDEGLIRELYNQAGFWHTTTYFAHPNEIINDDDKFGEHQSRLPSILKNGIRPAPDFLDQVVSNGRVKSSISLSKFRMHNRFYAEWFAPADLSYQWGSHQFWAKYLMKAEQFIEAVQFKVLLRNMESLGLLMRMAVSKDARAYVKEARANRNEWYQKVPERHNIEGNFPIMMGVKAGGVGPNVRTFLHNSSFEHRTDQAIDSSYISHLEVPLKHLDMLRIRLEALGIFIPVIPIEDGEVYMRKISKPN